MQGKEREGGWIKGSLSVVICAAGSEAGDYVEGEGCMGPEESQQ